MLVAHCLFAAACSDGVDEFDAGPAQPEVTTDSCSAAARRPNGSCCQVGAFWDHSVAACRPIGPPECADSVMSTPASCEPRWCPTWQTADGAACQAGDLHCLASGQGCPTGGPDAPAGCPAGTWPAQDECVPAGPLQASADLTRTGMRVPAGVPELVPLPSLSQTRFCVGEQGHARLCGSGEATCPPGTMPLPKSDSGDPDTPAQGCVPVGVPWSCPPGFVIDATPVTPTTLPACRPDPEDCGQGTWGQVPGGPDVRYVNAAAPPGGDGSAATPWSDLAVALAEAPTGSTLALAAGDYQGMFIVKKTLKLHGRCADMVRIVGLPGHIGTLLVNRDTVKLHLQGVTFAGETRGLGINKGTGHHIERVWFHNVRGTAVFIWHGAGKVDLQDSVIDNVRPLPDGSGEAGIISGAKDVTLSRVRVRRAIQVGILVTGKARRLTARELLVDESVPLQGIVSAGFGISVHDGAIATLFSTRVTHCTNTGVYATDKGTRIRLVASVVDHTRPDAKSLGYGVGVTATKYAHLELQGVRLHRNRHMGLGVEGSGAVVVAHGLLVDETLPHAASGLGGHGVGVLAGSEVELYDARMSRTLTAAVSVGNPSSRLLAERLLVDDTRPSKPTGQHGMGLVVQLGARAEVRNARLTGNRHVGAAAYHEGSSLSLQDVLVDGTEAGLGGKFGMGVEVGLAASADLLGVQLYRNRTAGLTAASKYTRVRAMGIDVLQTRPAADEPVGGMGVQVGAGASLDMVGSRMRDNHLAGLIAYGTGQSKVRAVGVEITGTKLEVDSGLFGTGAYALPGMQQFDLLHSRVVGNRSAGVAFYEAGGLVEACLIATTGGATYQLGTKRGSGKTELSDGIVAHKGQQVRLRNNVVFDQLRAGVLLVENIDVQAEGNRAAGGLYGIATEGNKSLLSIGNLWQGSLDNHAGDAALGVPPAPDVVQ